MSDDSCKQFIYDMCLTDCSDIYSVKTCFAAMAFLFLKAKCCNGHAESPLLLDDKMMSIRLLQTAS